MMHSSEHNPAAKWHMTVNVKKKKKEKQKKETIQVLGEKIVELFFNPVEGRAF